MSYTAWSVVYGEQPTAAKWNQLGANDAGFKDGTNIDNDAIKSRHIQLENNSALNALSSGAVEKMIAKLGTDNLLKLGQIYMRENTTNTIRENVLIQAGWGQVQGNGTNAVTAQWNFPVAFDSTPPILLVNEIGWKNTPAASAPSDFNTSAGTYIVGKPVSASQGEVQILHRDAGGSVGASTVYLGYSWIAIGLKA